MASSRDRQRRLARARIDRQMARRAAAARRKRQIRAAVGSSLAVLLVVLGSVWLFGGFESDPAEESAAPKDDCVWSLINEGNPNIKDVGTPPTTDVPSSGTVPMTIVTPDGDITANLDMEKSKCAVASMSYLSSKKFFNDTTCFELHPTFLRCGDPSNTGFGGPSYSFYGENVPPAPLPGASPSASASASPGADPSASASPGASPGADTAVTYRRGTVALIAPTPGNYGSQFVIFHKDYRTTEPTYSIIGTVIGGLPVLDKIVAAGTVDNGSGQNIKPAKEVVVRAVNVAEVFDESPAPSTSGQPTGSPAASPDSHPHSSQSPDTH